MTPSYEDVIKILKEKNLQPEDIGICPVCLKNRKTVVRLHYDPQNHEYYCPICGFVMEGEPKSDYVPYSKSNDEEVVTLRGKLYLLPNGNMGSHVGPSELRQILISSKTGEHPLNYRRMGFLLSNNSSRIKKEAYDILLYMKNYFETRGMVKLTYDDLNEIARIFDKMIKESQSKKKTYDTRLLVSAITFIYLKRRYLQYADDELLEPIYEAIDFLSEQPIEYRTFIKSVYKLKTEIISVIGEERVKLTDIVEAMAERFKVDPNEVIEILKICLENNLRNIKIDILILAIIRYILENRKLINVEKEYEGLITTRRLRRISKRVGRLLESRQPNNK